MTEYHVGHDIDGIYAGILKGPGEWEQKSDVTNEAMSAVARYLLTNDLMFTFNYNDANYLLVVAQFDTVSRS